VFDAIVRTQVNPILSPHYYIIYLYKSCVKIISPIDVI
jgi:hypothetical protein